MPVIIDGYNLLGAIHKAGDDFEDINDVQMCKMIVAYLRRTSQIGQIVFDGIGPPDKTPFDSMAPLEVVFSGRVKDADTVIENKIAANTAPRSLIVVSSDRRIRAAARKRKATSAKSDIFWYEVIKSLSKKDRPSPEPIEKRIGLSETETNLWLKAFGLDKD